VISVKEVHASASRLAPPLHPKFTTLMYFDLTEKGEYFEKECC